MLVGSLLKGVVTRETTLREGCDLLWLHPQIMAELRDLLDVLAEKVDHIAHALPAHSEVPLRVHARYTRAEIMAAFVDGATVRLQPWREGVHWARQAKADLFAFTLDDRRHGSADTPTWSLKEFASTFYVNPRRNPD